MGKVVAQDQSGSGMYRNLATGQGEDSMMAVGDAPWHFSYNEDMIRVLEEGTPVTSKEVNEIAGLNWQVYQTPAYIALNGSPQIDKDGNVTAMAGDFRLVGRTVEQGGMEPSYFLNVRDDTDQVIGVVKRRYTVFQNDVAPVFLDSLVDSGDLRYETAGSLYGGAQVWWLVKMPQGVTVAGDEREGLETYLLLTNSHDGSTSVVVAVVTVRVVCQNTLSWALGSAVRTTKIKHTAGAPAKFAEARRALELGYAYQAELAEIGDRMLHTEFSDEDFTKFLDSLVPVPEAVKKDGKVTNVRGITMAQNTRGHLTTIYNHNETQTWLKDTMWGAVQAAQYYADHMSISRNTSEASPDENRFMRLTSGQNLGSKAFDYAKGLLLPV